MLSVSIHEPCFSAASDADRDHADEHGEHDSAQAQRRASTQAVENEIE